MQMLSHKLIREFFIWFVDFHVTVNARSYISILKKDQEQKPRTVALITLSENDFILKTNSSFFLSNNMKTKQKRRFMSEASDISNTKLIYRLILIKKRQIS